MMMIMATTMSDRERKRERRRRRPSRVESRLFVQSPSLTPLQSSRPPSLPSSLARVPFIHRVRPASGQSVMASDYVTRMTTITCPCIHPAVHHQQHTCVMTSELISFARLITYTDTHCKKCPYIHGYSVASFPRFNGTAVPCTFVSDGIIGGTLQLSLIHISEPTRPY